MTKFQKTKDEYGFTWDYGGVFCYLQPDAEGDYLLEFNYWDLGWYDKKQLQELIEMLQNIEEEWPDDKVSED